MNTNIDYRKGAIACSTREAIEYRIVAQALEAETEARRASTRAKAGKPKKARQKRGRTREGADHA